MLARTVVGQQEEVPTNTGLVVLGGPIGMWMRTAVSRLTSGQRRIRKLAARLTWVMCLTRSAAQGSALHL